MTDGEQDTPSRVNLMTNFLSSLINVNVLLYRLPDTATGKASMVMRCCRGAVSTKTKMTIPQCLTLYRHLEQNDKVSAMDQAPKPRDSFGKSS
jgi:hypothetical protein